MRHRRTFRVMVLGAAGTALAAGITSAASAAPAPAHHNAPTVKPTIILVNGAWSDSASWKGVIKRLQADGYPVAAPPTRLSSVSGDSSYLAAYIKTVQGPVILVGQSYGGFVITDAATGNPQVKALVYISAFAPDQGENVVGLTSLFPGSQISDDPTAPVPTALSAVPFTQADGTTGIDLYAKADQYRNLFLSDQVSVADAAQLAATQSPVNADALGEPSGPPAWKTIPSWFLVSDDDHLIPPAAERFMAARAHSHTVEADTPHAAQVTDPGLVADLVEQAAKSVG